MGDLRRQYTVILGARHRVDLVDRPPTPRKRRSACRRSPPPPEGPIVQGREAVFGWLNEFPVIKKFEFSFDEIDGREDLATARGPVTMTIEVEGKSVTMVGKFLDTFRKQPDGTWLYHEVIWNRDAP